MPVFFNRVQIELKVQVICAGEFSCEIDIVPVLSSNASFDSRIEMAQYITKGKTIVGMFIDGQIAFYTYVYLLVFFVTVCVSIGQYTIRRAKQESLMDIMLI